MRTALTEQRNIPLYKIKTVSVVRGISAVVLLSTVVCSTYQMMISSLHLAEELKLSINTACSFSAASTTAMAITSSVFTEALLTEESSSAKRTAVIIGSFATVGMTALFATEIFTPEYPFLASAITTYFLYKQVKCLAEATAKNQVLGMLEKKIINFIESYKHQIQ